MRAEDVARHLRVQAERGILGVDDGFPLVDFAWAARVIEDLIAERDEAQSAHNACRANFHTMQGAANELRKKLETTETALSEMSNSMDKWRAQAMAERERCAKIALGHVGQTDFDLEPEAAVSENVTARAIAERIRTPLSPTKPHQHRGLRQ